MMLELNLQFFGGRGSGGGKGKSGGGKESIVKELTLREADAMFKSETRDIFRNQNMADAAQIWSSDRYKTVQQELRKENPNMSRSLNYEGWKVGDVVQGMDGAISQNKLSEAIVTYRIGGNELLGFKANEKITEAKLQKKGLIGATIQDPGYLATSVSKGIINDHIAKRNAKNATIYRITTSPGTGKGAYIKPFSLSPEQGEFTLKRGASLKVKGVSTDKETGRQIVDLSW